ncbi:uncharacterized protein MKZ38_006405 [Zalerion maritima]|uniref:PPM-type phosphatase domain-containing protein n=1 Tax=Zalerion maritima TaxID=339359 RepID=A0AAD5WPR8_9PEZI|nr:uncharacterized protein MKZ38_006405 [Zalerion maritima]
MRALRTSSAQSIGRCFSRALAANPSEILSPNLASLVLRLRPHIQSRAKATASQAIRHNLAASHASRLAPRADTAAGASGRAAIRSPSNSKFGDTRHFTSKYLRSPPPQYTTLHSSMYARGVGVALVSVLGYGAWSFYKGDGTDAFGIRPYSTGTHTTTTTAPAPGSGATGVDDASQSVRQVLVVSANELHTGTWVGDGPISKQTDGDGRRVIEMLTPDQATEKLRKNEESFFVNRGQGIIRYDLVQLNSNDPIEDDHSERIVEVPNETLQEGKSGNTDWMFWGVFDGHSGWTTSAKLRQSLIRYVARELNNTYKQALEAAEGLKPTPEIIDQAIKKGFTQLDNEIVHEAVDMSLKAKSKNKAAELLAPALSGSCALLSFYDPVSETLRVACTGDSRAVIGRKSENGKWVATPLSTDQTGSNPEEAARMRKEHPGEENKVVRNGRVLGGLEPTRAFGDAIYKWSRDIHQKLRQSFFVRSVSPDLQTPPYVTAEPVVTTTKVEPQNGDFMVMATDGLWEMLTNEEVVGLVGKWIETQQANGGGLTRQQKDEGAGNDGMWNKIWAGKPNAGLPVQESDGQLENGQKTPIRQQQWGMKPADDRFVVKDNNVATHLVRNALGGKNEEQVCALLTLPSPYSRRYRENEDALGMRRIDLLIGDFNYSDDLTVNVIFFGNTATKGQVEVNEDATSPLKPKL